MLDRTAEPFAWMLEDAKEVCADTWVVEAGLPDPGRWPEALVDDHLKFFAADSDPFGPRLTTIVVDDGVSTADSVFATFPGKQSSALSEKDFDVPAVAARFRIAHDPKSDEPWKLIEREFLDHEELLRWVGLFVFSEVEAVAPFVRKLARGYKGESHPTQHTMLGLAHIQSEAQAAARLAKQVRDDQIHAYLSDTGYSPDLDLRRLGTVADATGLTIEQCRKIYERHNPFI